MRLWHYKLIPVLPRQQLMGQWRELCLIAKNIHNLGSPHHILVNPIMNYPEKDFLEYVRLVYQECKRSGYNVKAESFFCHCEHFDNYVEAEKWFNICQYEKEEIFEGWHTDKYLDQCLMNLQEKHDRGGISDWDWRQIEEYCRNNYNFTVLNLYD